MFALIDCNNFYASCERVFNPKLMGRPVVVLSCNDGCVIARSQEAKDIGVPMGAPAFKSKDLFARYNVAVYSANFTLYGDMSHRVMKILSQYTPEIEIYSIDEAFLNLELKHHDLSSYGYRIREQVTKSTGIPISIGIAPTKTLAKISNHIAKKHKEYNGVCNWNEVKDKEKFLKNLSVGEIWGVGYRTSYKLNSLGIYNALQLRDANEIWLRKAFNITLLKTSAELKEISCLELEAFHEPRKGIMSSRSFGRPVERFEELEEAVTTYTTRACEKLREQKSAASSIYVSIKTNMHRKDLPQYFNYRISSLPTPSFYNPDFIDAGVNILKSIYKKGYRYKKATIMLLGIVQQSEMQMSLFEEKPEFNSKLAIMNTFDRINNRYGREVIKYASSGMKQPWRTKHQYGSERFTTEWEELLKIRI